MIRCHSAAITLKLKREVNEEEFAELVMNSHPWVNYVPNNKEESVSTLTPACISGSLKVGIGRYKKMSLNNEPIYSGPDGRRSAIVGSSGTITPHVEYFGWQSVNHIMWTKHLP